MLNSNLIHVDFKKPQLVSGQDRILLRSVWEQLKSSRSYSNWVDYSLKPFEINTDYGVLNKIVQKGLHPESSSGRPTIEHWVTINAAKEICMMSRTEEGKKVRQYFIECERLVYENNLSHQLTAIPEIMTIEFLAKTLDMARRLEAERDHAIKTKAEISDKKTATAMATASHAVRQKNKALHLVDLKEKEIVNLKEQLGEGEDWATAIVVLARYPKLRQSCTETRLGALLSRKSRELGYEIKRKKSPLYPSGVGIYHKNVIEAVRKQLLG